MNPAALLLSFSLLSAVNAQIVPAGEPPAPPAAAESREPDSGIPETRREPRNPKPESCRPGCPAPCRATVTLVDGSVLHGALRRRFLPARSPSLGEFRIDLAAVERIEFLPTSGGNSAGLDRRDRLARLGSQADQVPQVQSVQPVHDCRVSFTNGDMLTATLSPRHDRFVLDTLLGRVRLPLRAVSSISFNPSNPSTSSTPSTLLYHCTFDDASAISSPAAGPAGRFLGGSFVPGKKGNALRTFADQPAAEVDFEPGILGPRGTIEFWAKREEQTSFAAREGNLRFFGLWLHERGETPPWCSTHMQFTSNDGMGMSGLCGMVNHCSWATNPFFGHGAYDAIRDDPFGWHHYAVAWDADGLPGTKAPDGGPAVVAVYLDGKPLSTQGRQTIAFGAKHLKAIPGRFAKLAFPTPSNGWGSSGGHVPFLIDEFKIWSAPKTAFDLD